MKSVAFYPFSMSAGGTFQITTEGDYFRVQQALGTVSVTVEGSGTLPDLLSGQGIKNTPFNRLILKDTSGAANSGVILVASEEFIDNRTYGVNDLSAGSLATLRQPLAATGFYNNVGALAANTAVNVFSAASNLNGAIVLNASWHDYGANLAFGALLAKSTAPAGVNDGELIMNTTQLIAGAGINVVTGKLDNAQFIAAGNGLWVIAGGATNAINQKTVRFRLL